MIPIEEVINPLIVAESVIKQEMEKNEAERQAFIKANTEPAVKPTEQQQQEFNAIVDHVTENIKQAVAEPKYEPVKEDKPSPITARFTTKEINGRTDLQLIEDTVRNVTDTIEGLTCKVSKHGNIRDEYILEIFQNDNPQPIDSFLVYGRSVYGKGVPVLKGIANADGTFLNEYIPLKNEMALRSNILRKAVVKNINGEIITSPQGADPALMAALNDTICKDGRIFDHINMEDVSFDSDKEFAEFAHHLSLVLNKYLEIKKIALNDCPPFRLSSYKSSKKFHLVSDQAAFNRRRTTSVTFVNNQEVTLPATSAVNATIEVKGKKLIVREPGNKITNLEIKVDG